MTNVLPSEILAEVGTHLSKNDLCTCVRVCRLWNIALIPTLYGVVDICSGDQFIRFRKALHSVEKESALGHLVRVLKVSFDVDQEDFWYWSSSSSEDGMQSEKYDSLWPKDDLPRLCPFVTEFGLPCEWYPELSEFMQKWKHLTKISLLMCSDLSQALAFDFDFFRNRLTQLTIQCTTFSEWRDFVTKLPCVEYLNLLPVSSLHVINRKISISVLDLEIIHKALQFLRSLTIDRFRMYGEIAEDITPCGTVHELCLKPTNGDVWGRYFARKYSNLEKLELIDAWIDDENSRKGAIALLRSCQHLKSFKLPLNSYQLDSAYRQILEILYEKGIPVPTSM